MLNRRWKEEEFVVEENDDEQTGRLNEGHEILV